jgi:hypothetical protein
MVSLSGTLMCFACFVSGPPLTDPVAHRAEGVKQRKLHTSSITIIKLYFCWEYENLYFDKIIPVITCGKKSFLKKILESK